MPFPNTDVLLDDDYDYILTDWEYKISTYEWSGDCID